MLATITAPDFQALVEEDISETATAHLNKGLFVAHGLDEGGDGVSDVGAHDEMWYVVRDLALGPERCTRSRSSRIAAAGPAPRDARCRRSRAGRDADQAADERAADRDPRRARLRVQHNADERSGRLPGRRARGGCRPPIIVGQIQPGRGPARRLPAALHLRAAQLPLQDRRPARCSGQQLHRSGVGEDRRLELRRRAAHPARGLPAR